MIRLAIFQSAFFAVFWTTAMVVFVHMQGGPAFLAIVAAAVFALHFVMTLIMGPVFRKLVRKG